MTIKANKKYFNMPFSGLNGIFIDEKTMKKLTKLVYKQNQEMKELLTANIDGIEVASWTLAFPNGKQESIHHVDYSQTYYTKEHRISLVDRLSDMNVVNHLYFGTAEEAKEEHMKLYDGNTEVSLKED